MLPQLADLDGDGHLDLLTSHRDLVKEGRPDRVLFLRGLGNGRLARPDCLRREGGMPLEVGWDAGVCAADWDEDGDLDLILGHRRGDVAWLCNHGTAKKPLFKNDKPRLLRVPGEGPVQAAFGFPRVANGNPA